MSIDRDATNQTASAGSTVRSSSEQTGGEYTDSHCHLYDTRGADLDQVIDDARAAGVTTMINVGCDATTTAAAIDIANRYDGIYATAGLHPHDAIDGVATITEFIGRPKVIAVGECGLDYFYEHSPRDIQREAFVQQIRLAHQHRLPLVIHTRDAWADTFDVLQAEGAPEQTIFHCFTGGPEQAELCLEMGAYLSFSGIVTFKTATDLQASAVLCPLDRLLVETDSPYLAPIPFRGQPNRPAYVTNVVAFLANLRQQSLDELRMATVTNTCLAFPLLGS